MDNRPIGVFDSGLGGLTVLRELISALPGESMVYYGDTARVPYGTRSREVIIKYAVQDVNFLLSNDVKAIVIACGTVSSVALTYLRSMFDVPIFGVVSATAQAAAAATVNKRVGILGTDGTIKSGSFERALKKIDSEIITIPRACPLFVPFVESGRTDSRAAYLIAKEYLEPLQKAGVDTIILGCTHYPLLKSVISDIMGKEVALIDSGVPASGHVAKALREHDMLSQGNAQYRFYVSDTAENFSRFASMFLQREISGSVTHIDIEQY